MSIPDIKENAEDSAVVAHETPREQVKEEKKDYRDIEILKETIIEESHTSNQNYPEENESFPKDADTQHQQEAPEEDMSSAKFDDNNSYPIKQTSINFQNINSPAFNGITWNAVFPVPSSSLRTSVWSTVLQISHSNLGSNPFEVINIPLSDLLELTLPPVDSTTGSKHNLQLFITPQITNIENSDPISCRTQLAQDLPPIQKQANGLNNANNSSHESTSVGNGQNTTTNGSGSGIHALRQLFPGVNLSYGIQGRF